MLSEIPLNRLREKKQLETGYREFPSPTTTVSTDPQYLKLLNVQVIVLKSAVLLVQNAPSRAVDVLWTAGVRDAAIVLIRSLAHLVDPSLQYQQSEHHLPATAANILKFIDIVAAVCSRPARQDGLSLSADCVRAVMPTIINYSAAAAESTSVSIEALKPMRDSFDVAVSCVRCNIATFE